MVKSCWINFSSVEILKFKYWIENDNTIFETRNFERVKFWHLLNLLNCIVDDSNQDVTKETMADCKLDHFLKFTSFRCLICCLPENLRTCLTFDYQEIRRVYKDVPIEKNSVSVCKFNRVVSDYLWQYRYLFITNLNSLPIEPLTDLFPFYP